MHQKSKKRFFNFEIIAFQLLALNTRFYWGEIHAVGSQFVNKQSQDFIYYSDKIFGADILSEWWKKLEKNTAVQI